MVHLLRRRGLEFLLTLPDETAWQEFFDVFFTLPEQHIATYLSGREDLPGTARALAALFRARTARPAPKPHTGRRLCTYAVGALNQLDVGEIGQHRFDVRWIEVLPAKRAERFSFGISFHG